MGGARQHRRLAGTAGLRWRDESEHHELGPVKGISNGALDLGVPGARENPDQVTEAFQRDHVDVVEVGD
jgi:hypothetical protein